MRKPSTSSCRTVLPAVMAYAMVVLSAAHADWPEYRGSQQRTAYREQTFRGASWKPLWINDNLAPPNPAWPSPARGSLWQKLTSIDARVTDDRGDVPLIATDRNGNQHVIVCSSATDRLISLHPESGQLEWQFIADGPIRYAPSIRRGIAYFGSDDGVVRAVDLKEGQLLWSTMIGPELPKIVGNSRVISPHPVRTSVTATEEGVYAHAGLFPSQGVYSVGLNSQDGTLIWRRRTQRSPQGYLVADHQQRLFVPCGRAAPYIVDRQSGRFVSDCESTGGTFAMLTSNAFFSGAGSGKVVESLPRVPKAKILPIQGRAIAAGGGKLWSGDGTTLKCFDLTNYVGRKQTIEDWQVACVSENELIVSGDDSARYVFAAEANRVRIFDAETGRDVQRLQTDDPADQILRLAVSASSSELEHDTLIATTSKGRVYCWAAGLRLGKSQADLSSVWKTPGREKLLSTAAPDEEPDAVTAAINYLPCDTGLALLVNDNSGDLAAELIRRSRLQVVSVVSDSAVADELRLRFLADGQYGQRVSVLMVREDRRLPFSKRIFNLTMEGARSDRSDLELLELVNTGTGVVVRHDGGVKVREPSEKRGAWRHLYGNLSNTADSGDHAFSDAASFRLQWFGGVGPARIPDRHVRAHAPLAAGSAMVLHGDNCLIGVDPANGIERWQVDLPEDAVRYVIPYDAGYSCLTPDGATLYTATANEILKLNAFDGTCQQTYQLPADARRLRWGYLAETNGRLIASCMKHSAPRLKVDSASDDAPLWDRSTLREEYAGKDYGSRRPLVCSRWLTGLNEDGSPDWTYSADGVIPNSSISLDPEGRRLIFIEGTSQECRRHSSDRVEVPTIMKEASLVCLSVKTGQVLWKIRFSAPAAQNMLYTQVVDEFAVFSTSRSQEKEGATYQIVVVALSDGAVVWKKEHPHVVKGLGHGEQIHHPLALTRPSGDICLLAEPCMYDLRTGSRIAPTGGTEPWTLRRPGHSCGTISGAGSCVFFRASNPTVLNLDSGEDGGFRKLSPSRPSCWINMLPVDGRLLIPEGSASCVCLFPLQTSMSFIPIEREHLDVELPMLDDYPEPAEARVKVIHAWDFRSVVAGSNRIVKPMVGEVPLVAAEPITISERGIVMDGRQWLAIDPEIPKLPNMPEIVSLQASVSVAEDAPEWSGMVGAIQDNGDFERGCLLGIHAGHFFFAVASEGQTRLTYLEAPLKFQSDRLYNVTGTYDGNYMRLYIDGRLVGLSRSQSGPVVYSPDSWLCAGIYKDDNDHFPLKGILTRAAIYQGALTPRQIRDGFAESAKRPAQ